MPDNRGYTVRALGEVAIRCRDLDAMRVFYRDVVELTPVEGDDSETIAFFRIAPGHGGHTTVLALFQGEAPETGPASSLHHLALTLDAAEQEAARLWLAQHGVKAHFQEFEWIGWRGLFFADPEGNTVEFVAWTGPARAADNPQA